jgi:holo-[acyl-carrier protein] synthase
MIKGIGIDIVEIKRMESWIGDPNLLKRYFHNDEILSASQKKTSIAQTLAARFAAKEAFGKALGTGLSQIALKDIMIYNDENGKPEIKLFGTALAAFEKSGAAKIHVSLSHEKENAVCLIILEV